ncbi:MFS general substrate transporter [Ceratobasidium theobromae]|uniref:MFS general substrate transporter n=1 Tax=Ceratobasidium theobromae TaxID=1582974 RepID=A0A5N5Q8Z4_9AGAM|nr:MFS general substrate transporter [Ceratobasidium theobromae]
MNTQAAAFVVDASLGRTENSFPSTKLSHDDSNRLVAPPDVVVRARSTADEIEMNVLGSSRTHWQAPTSDEASILEPEVNSRKEWASIAACSMCLFMMTQINRLYGVGSGLQDAQSNGFVGSLRHNASAKMGLIHSVYGAGAFIASIIATQFAQRSNWSYHYLIPLALASLNTILIFTVFGFHTQEELLGPAQSTDPTESGDRDRKYQQIFGSWGIQAMAAFCLMYVGAEATMRGWVVMVITTHMSARLRNLNKHLSSLWKNVAEVSAFTCELSTVVSSQVILIPFNDDTFKPPDVLQA